MQPPVLNTSRVATILVGIALAGVQLGCTKNLILNNQQLKILLAHARTSEDHLRLAAHYHAKAVAYESDAKQHDELAAYYRNHDFLQMQGVVAEAHCQEAALAAHDFARRLQTLAADHEKIAKSLDKKP